MYRRIQSSDILPVGWSFRTIRDTIEAALRQIAPRVAQEEPGCRFYQASRSQENPDNFLLYEHYVDEAALLAHRETPHFQEIIEGTIVPLLEQRERELYTLAVG